MQQKGSQVGRGETKRKEKKPELEDVGLGEMLERVFFSGNGGLSMILLVVVYALTVVTAKEKV